MNFIVLTTTCAQFFGISNEDFVDKSQCYRWSGAFQDVHFLPTKDNDEIYGMTGAGAFLCLPFLEKVNKTDILTYMNQIQKLSGDDDILEEMSEMLVAERDRTNLLWLVDRLVLFDPRKIRLHDKINQIVIPDRCFYCGAELGETHRVLFCGNEECCFCGEKSPQCECEFEQLGLYDKEKYTGETAFLPEDIYVNGLSDDLYSRWVKLFTEKGRKPYQGQS